MTENGLFVLGRAETQLHDILWAVHDGKNYGRSEGEENIGVFPVTMGGWGRAMHGGIARFSRTRTRVGARRWALTEPEQPTVAGGGRRETPWMNSRMWRLEEVDGG